MFLFLGKGVQEVFSYELGKTQQVECRCHKSTVGNLQMLIVPLAWYEDFTQYGLCQSSLSISLVRKGGGNASNKQDFC